MKERPILLFVVDIFTRKGRKNFDIHLYFFFFFIVSQLFILSHFLQHYIGYLYFQFNRTSLFYFIYICIYFLDSIIFSNCQFSFKSKRQHSPQISEDQNICFFIALSKERKNGGEGSKVTDEIDSRTAELPGPFLTFARNCKRFYTHEPMASLSITTVETLFTLNSRVR